MRYPLKHVLVCTGDRCNDSERGKERGESIQSELKDLNKKLGRKRSVRVCKVSCLDLCDFGPNMIIEGTVYAHLTRDTAAAAYEGEMGDGPKRPDLELREKEWSGK